MASNRFGVLPSCRKKSRWPSPQSGAVRNSLGPAAPCETPDWPAYCWKPPWCSDWPEVTEGGTRQQPGASFP